MNVTCNKCGRVHFTVTQKYIKAWKKEWVHYYATWSKEQLAAYGITDGPPSADQYYKCFKCGNDYRDFRDSTPEEIRPGSTLQPICRRSK